MGFVVSDNIVDQFALSFSSQSFNFTDSTRHRNIKEVSQEEEKEGSQASGSRHCKQHGERRSC